MWGRRAQPADAHPDGGKILGQPSSRTPAIFARVDVRVDRTDGATERGDRPGDNSVSVTVRVKVHESCRGPFTRGAPSEMIGGAGVRAHRRGGEVMGKRFVAVAVAVGLAVSTALVASVGASDTPAPTTVTIAGSLQSELGCAGDWDPACSLTQLSYDANGDAWVGSFTVPAGAWAYKAPLNGTWDENYGAGGVRDGADIAFEPRSTDRRHVPLLARDALGHRRRGQPDRHRTGRLPERAGVFGRLGPELPPLVAAGPRRRRHLHIHVVVDPRRYVRGQGRDRPGVGRELRRRRHRGRCRPRVHGRRGRHGHVLVRLRDQRAHRHGRRRRREHRHRAGRRAARDRSLATAERRVGVLRDDRPVRERRPGQRHRRARR